MEQSELSAKSLEELREIAREAGVPDYQNLTKEELVQRLLPEQEGLNQVSGVLEILPEGYGFIHQDSFAPRGNNVYISPSQIKRFGLRSGDIVGGKARPPKNSERYPSLVRIETVNEIEPTKSRTRPHFHQLTPVFPHQQIKLETTKDNLSTRLLDLITPIGRGQRGLIVSPPKAGKTTLLKDIANGAAANYPDLYIMILLVGERPEEVTDIERSVKGEVISATFDEPVEVQTKVAELALERVKRLVELGQDVLMLVDGITRLTRAYNLALPPSGRTLSGGIDSVALHPAKRFFGAARCTEGGGSLTIIATCLIDTGSRMDELIYEEFKGTGNMEIHLDRKLAERRIFPALDIIKSGTRREELLFDEWTLKQVRLLRRMLYMITADSNDTTEATVKVLERLARTSSNKEFLATLAKEI